MTETVNVKNIGLRGVTVACTKISFIGEKEILVYRGYRIEDLAEHSSFMEVTFLILNRYLPTKKELREFPVPIRDFRQIPEHIYGCYTLLPKESNPMDVLQATIPFPRV